MNKIIEINDWELADVAGGCYCYCSRKPFDMAKPTIMIGEVADENTCRSKCREHSGFHKCASELPKPWVSRPIVMDLTGLNIPPSTVKQLSVTLD